MFQSQFILQSFWGTIGNCVIVAYLKAMLAGTKMFTVVIKGNKISVALRDGFSITLSQKEINSIAKNTGISYRRYKDRAQKQQLSTVKQVTKALFAILVIRLQLQQANNRALTYVKIIESLTTTGISTKNMHTLLGLKRKKLQHFAMKKQTAISKKAAVLLANKKHIAFCSFGCFDNFGEPVTIRAAREKFMYGVPLSYFELY